MLISEIISEDEDILFEAQIVWARKGSCLVKKYRCTSGIKKGRLVSNPGECNKPINLKKRASMKKTRAIKGPRMTKKAQRIKRTNPISRTLKLINKKTKR